YSEDYDEIQSWSPLIMKERQPENIASTKMDGGTDVNFGELTRKMMDYLQQDDSVKIHYNNDVVDIKKTRSEEHTSELQSRFDLVCRLLLEKKKQKTY